MNFGQTASMTYTRLQNYKNIMVVEHGIQTFKVVIVMLLFWLLSFSTSA